MIDREKWIADFEGKKILVWGYGREGKASCKLIREVCPDLFFDIAESRKSGAAILEQAKRDFDQIGCYYDDEVDFSAYDLILKSPGIVLPEGMDTSNISGATQLFLKHYGDRTIGITGTKGKSTTTSLVAAALATKYRVHLVGNIGVAAFECIDQLQEGDLIAYELGCHQLEYCPYSPHIGVLLNLYSEHLDHYGTIEKYAHAKQNVYRHQDAEDHVILGKDLLEEYRERPDAIRIGVDFGARGKTLYIADHELEIKDCALIGDHNYVNASVAYYIAHTYFDVSDEQFLQAMATFRPLAHRLEDLGEFEDIRFVNDSISTIGQATIAALKALKNVDTVLVGGMDRGIDYLELEEYLSAHPEYHVIFMYGSGKRIYQEMQNQGIAHTNMEYCATLSEAVEAGRLHTTPHHICLLSPAASSYDSFKSFEERGEIFRKLAFRL